MRARLHPGSGGVSCSVNDLDKVSCAAELQRALRVCGQSLTAYAVLRDRYRFYANFLDLLILLISAWLVAMVFVQVEIADVLTPPGISRELWLGLLAIGSFCLSL